MIIWIPSQGWNSYHLYLSSFLRSRCGLKARSAAIACVAHTPLSQHGRCILSGNLVSRVINKLLILVVLSDELGRWLWLLFILRERNSYWFCCHPVHLNTPALIGRSLEVFVDIWYHRNSIPLSIWTSHPGLTLVPHIRSHGLHWRCVFPLARDATDQPVLSLRGAETTNVQKSDASSHVLQILAYHRHKIYTL